VLVCGRSLARIAGSNPARGMGVSCECRMLSGRGLCVYLITRPEESYWMWYVWVRSWSLDNEEALAHWRGGGRCCVMGMRGNPTHICMYIWKYNLSLGFCSQQYPTTNTKKKNVNVLNFLCTLANMHIGHERYRLWKYYSKVLRCDLKTRFQYIFNYINRLQFCNRNVIPSLKFCLDSKVLWHWQENESLDGWGTCLVLNWEEVKF
jgi:hypothetical protein